MHANDKGQMNGYIGNDNRKKKQTKDRHGGTNYTYGDIRFLSCLLTYPIVG